MQDLCVRTLCLPIVRYQRKAVLETSWLIKFGYERWAQNIECTVVLAVFTFERRASTTSNRFKTHHLFLFVRYWHWCRPWRLKQAVYFVQEQIVTPFELKLRGNECCVRSGQTGTLNLYSYRAICNFCKSILTPNGKLKPLKWRWFEVRILGPVPALRRLNLKTEVSPWKRIKCFP